MSHTDMAADEKADETVVETNIIRAMKSIENKDTIADGELPHKEEEDDEDNPNNELAATTEGRGTQEKKKKHQQQRKRHGARNQHKMKYFVRWLLETFPDILVQPSPLSSSSPNQQGNKWNATSCAHNTSSCNCDAEQQAKQKEEEVEVEPSRIKTKSSSCCAAKYDDDMIHDDDDAATKAPVPLVLDVAGGKGELAARLCLCLHLRVVLVDPRPANIAQTYQQTVVPRLPKKWQERLQQRLCTNPNHVQDILKTKFHQVVDYFSYQKATTVDNEHDDDDNHHQQQKVLLRLQQAVQDASLLIGMHADGATEDIIDVALHYQKPFVVVPCCVFANLYSHRQVRGVVRDKTTTTATNEEPQDQPQTNQQQQQQQESPPPSVPVMTFASVRTHEQFCQYLLDKDARFQKSILPFEGRNVAIWWNGK